MRHCVWRHCAVLAWLATLLPTVVSQGGAASEPCGTLHVSGGVRSANGEYDLVVGQTAAGRPVYRHSCKTFYVFYLATPRVAYWLLGPEVGRARGVHLSHDAAAAPGDAAAGSWRKWTPDNGWTFWVAAPEVNVRCKLPTCRSFELDGPRLAASLRGTYTLQEATHDLRPVYKHATLAYYAFYDVGCHNWRVGPDPAARTAVLWVCSDVASPEYAPRRWTRLIAIGVNETIDVSVTCTARVGDKDLNPPRCGVSLRPKSVGATILGGHDALPDQYPWLVSILRPDGIIKCGGALISHRWILTAAHCIDRVNAKNMRVAIGLFDHNAQNIVGKQHSVKRAIAVPGFLHIVSPFKMIRDLALVELDNDVPFSLHVQSVCLPPDNATLPYRDDDPDPLASVYSDCVAVGWGRQTRFGPAGGPLQESGVTRFKSRSWCIDTNYQDLRSWIEQTPTTCVYLQNRGMICKGDSGSPLLCRRDSHWMMVGVGSWSPVSCSAPDHPSGFVINAPFDAWIRSYIK